MVVKNNNFEPEYKNLNGEKCEVQILECNIPSLHEVRTKVKEEILTIEDNVNIKVIVGERGCGKTRSLYELAIKEYEENKTVAIFSREHKHLSEEIEMVLIKYIPEKDIIHLVGFEKGCELLNNAREDILAEVVREFLSLGISVKTISIIFCSNCPLREQCKYHTQFREIKKGKILLAPYEHLRLETVVKNVDVILCDESIEKVEKFSYTLRRSRIEKATDIKTYERYLNDAKLERKKFSKNLEELRRVLLKLHEEVIEKSYLLECKDNLLKDRAFEKRLKILKKVLLVRKVELRPQSYQIVSYPFVLFPIVPLYEIFKDDFLIFVNPSVFLELFEFFPIQPEIIAQQIMKYIEVKEAFEKIRRDLLKILTKAIERRDKITLLNIVALFEVENLLQINQLALKHEKIEEKEIEIGEDFEGKKAWLTVYRPLLFDLFEAALKGKRVIWTCASLSTEVYQIWLKKWLFRKKLSRLVRDFYHTGFPKTKTINPLNPHTYSLENLKWFFEEDYPLTTKIINIKYSGKYQFPKVIEVYDPYGFTFSRSSFQRREEWKVKMKVLDEEGVGVIGYKFLRDKFKKAEFRWWHGSSLKGSNVYANMKTLYIIGKPNPPEEQIILNHFLLFDSFPSFHNVRLKLEGREKAGYENEKLDFIYKITVEEEFHEAIHRATRGDKRVPMVYVFGRLTEYVRQKFRTFSMTWQEFFAEKLLEAIKNKAVNISLEYNGIIIKPNKYEMSVLKRKLQKKEEEHLLCYVDKKLNELKERLYQLLKNEFGIGKVFKLSEKNLSQSKIAKMLNTSPNKVNLAFKSLIKENKLRIVGAKRGATYILK